MSKEINLFKYDALSPEQVNAMMDNALLVFDTSALCSIYNLTEQYRTTLITILSYLKQRIWLPRQVAYEYQKNRLKAIYNPKVEKYTYPPFIKDKFVDDVRVFISQWKDNKYCHPFINEVSLNIIETEVEEVCKHIRIIKDTVKKEYDCRKTEIDTIPDNDPLFSLVCSLSIEPEYPISSLLSIVKEGSNRYLNNIPPGYLDKDKPDEGNPFRKYGDLIIWKSIIKHAKEIGKDVIFITDDIKNDWRIDGKPRAELQSEFHEESGKLIDIQTLNGFIEGLKNHFKDSDSKLPLFDSLDDVAIALKRIFEEKKSGHFVFKCDCCGEIFKVYEDQLWLEWELNSVEERGMGCEREWYCDEHVECPYCDSGVDISLCAYEYPEGHINSMEIECDGAKLIKRTNFSDRIPIHNYSEDICICCGKHTRKLNDGLCIDCQDKFNNFLNKD